MPGQSVPASASPDFAGSTRTKTVALSDVIPDFGSIFGNSLADKSCYRP
jgi:hypothetical protein